MELQTSNSDVKYIFHASIIYLQKALASYVINYDEYFGALRDELII